MSVIEARRGIPGSSPKPAVTSGTSESSARSDPWLPPPAWWCPPASANSHPRRADTSDVAGAPTAQRAVDPLQGVRVLGRDRAGRRSPATDQPGPPRSSWWSPPRAKPQLAALAPDRAPVALAPHRQSTAGWRARRCAASEPVSPAPGIRYAIATRLLAVSARSHWSGSSHQLDRNSRRCGVRPTGLPPHERRSANGRRRWRLHSGRGKRRPAAGRLDHQRDPRVDPLHRAEHVARPVLGGVRLVEVEEQEVEPVPRDQPAADVPAVAVDGAAEVPGRAGVVGCEQLAEEVPARTVDGVDDPQPPANCAPTAE